MTVLFVTPVEILTGVSVGLLFGVVVALLVGGTSFASKYFADEGPPPIAGGTVTAVVTAGALYAVDVVDPSTAQLGLYLGLGLVLVLGLYATTCGTRLAADLPRDAAGPIERTKPLAAEAIDAVDAMGQVTIRSSGGVREFEGYPPLGPDLRATLEDGAWRFPADLPLSELETRLEDRLRTTYDLEAVSVSVDGRGRATITAAPPASGVAKEVPDGWRAVSIRALLPTGLAPGDDVLAVTDSGAVSGTVLSATVDASAADHESPVGADSDDPRADRSGADGASHAADTVASGGDGRVTVAVRTTDAEVLLSAERARIAVTPRGTTHEFDAISLLDRGDPVIGKVTLTDPILDAVADDETSLEVFAVRRTDASDDESIHEHEWQFEPDREAVAVGAEAFLLGTDATAFGPRSDGRDPAALEVSH
ncbi:hypothetical protein ACFO5R_04080 [Halosolutus amylolyticus]|uniref:RCK C-terminal domain-containing protein n=1 Tax=Halosolutus amylolyticus TaxID=2932267 RepID=A0ABD5PKK2_9EURY|nr:hypothetical protein [Halosolutus amylolyticus]